MPNKGGRCLQARRPPLWEDIEERGKKRPAAADASFFFRLALCLCDMIAAVSPPLPARHRLLFPTTPAVSQHTRTPSTMLPSIRVCARKAAAAAPSAGNKLRTPRIEQTVCRAFATVPGPRLFDYQTVTSVLKQSDAVEAVEAAFGMLAKGKVDVPIPMHIGIDESANAGPGDCHIKGGYISGTSTWTVKLANVSFYKNIEKVGRPWGGMERSGLLCHLLACLIFF